jgi:hypothetical protein
MAQVAIIIPTMRAHRLAAVVETIVESTSDYRIVVIATGECANAARLLPVTLIDDGGGTWPERINRGVRETTEPYCFTAADDLAFRPGWFEAALSVMNTIPGGGLVAVNDLMNRAGVHFLISREYIDTVGGSMADPPGIAVHEGFKHAYCDDFARRCAQHRGRWGFADQSIVEHLHCGVGKSPIDDIYRLGEATMSDGHATFLSLAYLFE